MPAEAFQESKVQDGCYKEGEWFCACDIPAKWLTSKKETSKGAKFLRCENYGLEQCRFFLWEKDELEAREQGALPNSDVPRTPTRVVPGNNVSNFQSPTSATRSNHPSIGKSKIGNVGLPTPTSRDNTSRGTFIRSADMSPTPRRVDDVGLMANEDEDLSTTVLELLRANNVEVKGSTEVLLRHAIGSKLGVYQSQLRTSERTITELCRKVDNLEKELEKECSGSR